MAGTAAAAEPARTVERSPRDYTPQHLADKILRSRSAIEGERKQLTVLFADVKSSLELSEDLDPETWHEILDRFFEILSEGVHRFEGTVNQYTGDGIMALFGAPIAHEDHAPRACYAALHLLGEIQGYAREVKREHGVEFLVRMGIHSGEVVVGRIGDDLRMDYTAQGHTVGIASRMEALAEPNSCFLSETTAALAGGYLALDDLGAFRVKGVSDPVGVFQLRGIGPSRTRFDVSRARGLSRFVGRADDMRTLEAALAQAQAGNGQVVGIVAEAGTGKSRLCFEFLERCRAQGYAVLEGQAVSHGRNIPFLPALQILRSYFAIDDQDSAQTAREKIAGRLLLIDEQLRDVLPVMFDFLGVHDPEKPAATIDPDARKRQLFGVLRKVVRQIGPDSRRVALLEDLHWMDDASAEFIEQWVEAVAGTGALLLVNFRPEFRADWMQKSYYRRLPLIPLGPEAVRELLDDLLGSDGSIAGLAESIHARTGGNPFFTEEVVRSLIDAGNLEGSKGSYRLVTPVEQLAVPDSVQSLLAARIDRLSEAEKQVLQAAAVIGKEFAQPVLEEASGLASAVVAASLSSLTAREFIYEQAIYPVAEFAFKHPLTQEVAYGSQLRDRRRELHGRVAAVLERIYAETLDERAALLAHHWEEAGEIWKAAGFHARAARWSARRDPRPGYLHWSRVADLLTSLPESREVLTLALEARTNLALIVPRVHEAGEEMERRIAEGLALADRLQNPGASAMLRASSGFMWGLRGNMDRARADLDAAISIALEQGNAFSIHQVRAQRLRVENLAGNFRRAGEELDQVEPYQADPKRAFQSVHPSLRQLFMTSLGVNLAVRGRMDEGIRYLDHAVELATETQEAEGLGQSYVLRASVFRMFGDPARQLEDARRGYEIALENGSNFAIGPGASIMAVALAENGMGDEAVETSESGLRHFEAWGERVFLCVQLASLTLAKLASGDGAGACKTGREAVAAGKRLNARGYGIDAGLACARALIAHEGAAAGEEIHELLRQTIATASEIEYHALIPALLEERAKLEVLMGDRAAARSSLREAHALCVEMGATARAERLAREIERAASV